MREINRLGQLLIERGWAAPEGVMRALRMQRSAPGDYLGTSLLEIGVIDEETLVRALSELHRVPPATADDLRSIPPETIALVPARLARRCKAVPFRSSATRVAIAVRDPGDLGCQDEIAFAVGRRLQVHVAAEVRVAEALERYYGEPSTSRLAILIERLNRSKYLWRDEAGGAGAGPRSHDSGDFSLGALGTLEVRAPALPSPPPPRRSPTPAAASPARPAPRFAPPPPVDEPASVPLDLPLDEEPEPPAEPGEAAAAPERNEGGREEPAEEPAAPAEKRLEFSDLQPLGPETGGEPEAERPQAGAPPPTLEQTLSRLAEPSDPDRIADLLLAHLGPLFERVALFKVHHGRVDGWRGTGGTLDEECLRRFTAELDEPSLFHNLHRGGAFFVGPPPPMPVHRRFGRCLGNGGPTECVMLPVRVAGRLATVIYADRGSRGLERLELDDLQRVAAAAGDAYERAILQRKKD